MTDSATITTPQAGEEELSDLLLEVLPPDGSTIGNKAAREASSRVAERQISEEEYEDVKEKALALAAVTTRHPQRQQQATDAAEQQLPLPQS